MDEEFVDKNMDVINKYFDDSVNITKEFMENLDPESCASLDRGTLICLGMIANFLNEYLNGNKNHDAMKLFMISANKAIIQSKESIPELIRIFQSKMQDKLPPLPDFNLNIQKGDEDVF